MPVSALFDLPGKVALNTGASHGLGQYMGRALTFQSSDRAPSPITVRKSRSRPLNLYKRRDDGQQAADNTEACWQSRSLKINHEQTGGAIHTQEVTGSSPVAPTT